MVMEAWKHRVMDYFTIVAISHATDASASKQAFVRSHLRRSRLEWIAVWQTGCLTDRSDRPFRSVEISLAGSISAAPFLPYMVPLHERQ